MVDQSYDKFKKSSIIIYDGNPSTGKSMPQLIELKPQKRHDELYK